jgi:hypothetical protein
MSRLLPRRFFALVPVPELEVIKIGTGARPSCYTRPRLRSRPLSQRWGCSSAEPYPPPRPYFSLKPACSDFHATSCTARPASPTVSHRPQSPIAYQGRRDVSDRAALAAKRTDAVPFPRISLGGTGTTPPRDQSSRCHPAAVRLNRPAHSSDSSTSLRRSFLTARQSRGLRSCVSFQCRLQ